MSTSAFPTFRQWLQPRNSGWRLSPWWPGETHQAKQHSLLHILAIAHAQHLDPAPLIDRLADEHRGMYRRTLRRFAERLAAGVPLIAALEQTPEVLSEATVLAIRFGSQSGALDATYEQLLQWRSSDSSRLQATIRSELAYWGFLLATIVVALMYLMNSVAPILIKIANDFGVRLPDPFITLTGVVHHAVHYPILWILAALAIAWLFGSASPRRFFRRVLAERLLGSIGQRRSAELLQLLAIAVDTGRPIPGSLSTLARYHFDKHLRQKLLYARNEVEQGADVWASLADAKILTPGESQALAGSPSPSVRAWTLRRLSVCKQADFYRKATTALMLLRPIVVLFFAAIVLWIALAFFGVLTHFTLLLA